MLFGFARRTSMHARPVLPVPRKHPPARPFGNGPTRWLLQSRVRWIERDNGAVFSTCVPSSSSWQVAVSVAADAYTSLPSCTVACSWSGLVRLAWAHARMVCASHLVRDTLSSVRCSSFQVAARWLPIGRLPWPPWQYGPPPRAAFKCHTHARATMASRPPGLPATPAVPRLLRHLLRPPPATRGVHAAGWPRPARPIPRPTGAGA